MPRTAPVRRISMPLRLALSTTLLLLAAGCGLGPKTVAVDRVGYGEAVARSGREELLRNIVRLRYLDSPVFLAVGSMTNSYSFDASVGASAGWNFGLVNTTSNSLNGSSGFANRPTIVYSPVAGERFARAYLRPIPTASVLALVQAGYRVDFLFPLLVESIEYHRNGSNFPGRVEVPTDSQFVRIIEILTEMQGRGEFFFRAAETESGGTMAQFLDFDPDFPADSRGRIDELCELLDVPTGSASIRIESGTGSRAGEVISFQTRSLLMIMAHLSGCVEVSDEEVAAGRAAPVTERSTLIGDRLRIRSGTTRPDDAYVAIQQRGRWFWIDEADLDSKQIFFTLMILTNLTDTSAGQDAPLLTIPAG